MNELVPIMLERDGVLNRVNWCYQHKQYCVRGPSFPAENDGELNFALMGSPCVVSH